ncbi:MAG: zinc ribbon-containing protein [Gammaproteobacteria bacterium]|nr:zinc ribbon-containing protein [Gammaproteobacteria bacterium]
MATTQTHGYRKLLDDVKQLIEQAGEKSGPVVEKLIQQAEERLSQAEEFSREESAQLAEYLKRDIHDAASFMERTGSELGDWLRLDILKLETGLADALLKTADKTRTELAEWAMRSELHTWRSGEITGPGVLLCKDCGEELHFHEPGHIPPCPKCHGSHFQRIIE